MSNATAGSDRVELTKESRTLFGAPGWWRRRHGVLHQHVPVGPAAGLQRRLPQACQQPSNPANTYSPPPPTVGVEFDEFRNTWDPDNVGVDVNGIMSESYTALLDGSFNGTMSAWVRYDASSGELSVTLAFLDQPCQGPY
ncbi:hypothetical protein U9M48_000662, partial [Paspalum notatum var. saurae]